MYQIMIVDDEPLILAGIASLLDWEKQECVIAGKAGNGQQALKLAKERCELTRLANEKASPGFPSKQTGSDV